MEKDLKIITLESLKGAGVSTQVRLLKQQFILLGYEVKVIKFIDNDRVLDQVCETKAFLDSHSKAIVINDGCFAKTIASDILDAYSQHLLEDKYKYILYEYEYLKHEYELINIVLLPDDELIGHQRLAKYAKILEKECKLPKDLLKEKHMLKVLGILDSHVITRTIRFHTVDIDSDDKILDINDKIWELLGKLGIKKPSEEG